MIIELLGEIVVELFYYGTIEVTRRILIKLPICWNEKLLKGLSIIFGIVFWIFVGYVIIKTCEWLL